jgi:uncharacterized membrane protein YoaK (UPF0700 family)
MPIDYLRRLTGHERDQAGNRHLGYSLAFIAGAANAGGFLAVGQYTSHMTGIVSTMADSFALGEFWLAGAAVVALVFFLAGAATTAVLINWARRRHLRSQYALSLLLEAALLLVFGLAGAFLADLKELLAPATVLLLCFIMGLQNAVMSKITHSEIRTTHITGTITDIGIELGKLVYWNDPGSSAPPVRANSERLRMLLALAGSFFLGGLLGAWGFKGFGYLCTVPLALVLVVMACVPALDDLRERWQAPS